MAVNSNAPILMHHRKDRPKTSIICTIGPSVFSPKKDSNNQIKKDSKGIPVYFSRLQELINNGMSVARINCSWVDTNKGYSFEDVKLLIDIIRELESKNRTPIGIMLDLKGPEIRVCNKIDIELKNIKKDPKNECPLVVLRQIDGPQEIDTKQLTVTKLSCKYQIPIVQLTFEGNFYLSVDESKPVFIDDGNVGLKVIHKDDTNRVDVLCEVQYGEVIKQGKGVNLRDVWLDTQAITAKDKQVIYKCFDVDFIAQSFVREANDASILRGAINFAYENNTGDKINIIAKIENPFARKSIDKILENRFVDAIMVARGDLGVEIEFQNIPEIQKELIEKANIYGKPVIVATQMLDSMERRPTPTRAEVQDVANAVAQGADAVMLSGETASGKYPDKAVESMRNILLKEEKGFDRDQYLAKLLRYEESGAETSDEKRDLIDTLGNPIREIAERANSPVIVSYGTTGATASKIAKYRPSMPIIVISNKNHLSAARFLLLYNNLYPVILDTDEKLVRTPEQFIRQAKKIILNPTLKFGKEGELVIGTLLLEEKEEVRSESRLINLFRL